MTMYIRFGAPPACGRSYDYETDTYEPGVSCYRAEWQSSDRDVLCVSIPSDVCVATINRLADRPVYIVTGDLLDERGGDGEPLLVNVSAEYVGPVEVVTYCIDED